MAGVAVAVVSVVVVGVANVGGVANVVGVASGVGVDKGKAGMEFFLKFIRFGSVTLPLRQSYVKIPVRNLYFFLTASE